MSSQAAAAQFDIQAERPSRTLLAAGGTLPGNRERDTPGSARRVRLAVEMTVLFIGAPIAMTWAIHSLRLPLFLVLQPMLIGLVLYLLWDRGFHLRRELARGFALGELVSMLAVFVCAALALGVFVALELPELLLAFPRYRPAMWLMVVTLYPLMSVLAQELVYRTFFFHRYGPLFGDRRHVAIATNGVLFGFGHIIFGNWIAVTGTLFLGLLVAWRYERTRSFWAAWLEHSLYGWLVFTIGIGGFFFTGVAF